MHICLLDGFKNTRFGKAVEGKLDDDLLYVKPDVFGDATGIDVSDWLTSCPDSHCGKRLVISRLSEDEKEYGVFCPHCGWTPRDGYNDFNRLYYTISEVADMSGLSYRRITEMVRNEIIGAVNFGSDARASWRIPVYVGDKFSKAGGAPGWQLYWAGVQA
jgi:hypothetical protein